MAYARSAMSSDSNAIDATLIAYDLQAGSYLERERANPSYSAQWCEQLFEILKPLVARNSTLMEVGVGEATSLTGVLRLFGESNVSGAGFDLSWSRIKYARQWLREHSTDADLFVADMFHIPLTDDAIDVVYSSHSLEPNGGNERNAITELLRVAKKWVVLVEPIFELASEAAQNRMLQHGYVRGLKDQAESLGAEVVEYRLLDVTSNPLNPSGVLLIKKSNSDCDGPEKGELKWSCPVTSAILKRQPEFFYAEEVGIAYPVLGGVPMLRPEHAIVASAIAEPPA